MTVDAHYFDGWEKRVKSPTEAEIKEAQRYCYCGHILGVHYSMATMDSLKGPVTYGKWRCHGSGCVCEKWRWDRRIRSKIKRFPELPVEGFIRAARQREKAGQNK